MAGWTMINEEGGLWVDGCPLLMVSLLVNFFFFFSFSMAEEKQRACGG